MSPCNMVYFSPPRFLQFMEIQHDQSAQHVLFTSDCSRALMAEMKIFLFASLIDRAPFFRALRPKGVACIIDHLTELTFSPGDFVIRKGMAGGEMFFIMRGVCSVWIE